MCVWGAILIMCCCGLGSSLPSPSLSFPLLLSISPSLPLSVFPSLSLSLSALFGTNDVPLPRYSPSRPLLWQLSRLLIAVEADREGSNEGGRATQIGSTLAMWYLYDSVSFYLLPSFYFFLCILLTFSLYPSFPSYFHVLIFIFLSPFPSPVFSLSFCLQSCL